MLSQNNVNSGSISSISQLTVVESSMSEMQVSVPLPPSNASSPASPVRVSSPFFPFIVSLPAPP